MLNPEEQLIDWQWDVEFVNNSVVDRFVEDVELFLESLKEKMSIDKRAAVFFKEATRNDVNWEMKQLRKLPLLSNYILELPCVEPVKLEIEKGRFLSEEWKFDGEFREFDFSKLVPKDTIYIKKEITSFIKSCIKGRVELPRIGRLSTFKKDQMFFVEDLCQYTGSTHPIECQALRKIPSSIEIPKDTDWQLMEEDIDEEVVEDLQLTDAFRPQKLRVVNSFKLYEEETAYAVVPYVCTVPKWMVEIQPIDMQLFKSWERHYTAEELLKGAEFRLDPPFMNDQPVFKEPMNAFEFSSSSIPPSWDVPPLKLPFLIDYCKTLNENELITEELEDPNAFIVEGTVFEFKNIIGTMEFLIDDSEVPLSTQVSHENVSLSHKEFTEALTKIEDSNLKIIESRDALSDSDTTRNDTVADTLCATKMSTFLNSATVGDITSKRTIDDEIDELITKKRSRITGGEANSTMLPIFKLLNNDGVRSPPRTSEVLEKDFIKPKLPITPSMRLKPQFDSNNAIVFNSFFLNQNSDLLKALDKFSSLQIIEYDLGETQPDFLISPKCGMVLLSSSTLDQTDVNGDLKIQPRIVEARKLLSKLHIVIVTDNLIKKELIFNFQLSLAMMDISSTVVDKSLHSICEELCSLAYHEGSQKTEDELSCLEEKNHQFLVECGVNVLAAAEILQKMNVLEFLTMDREKRDEMFHGLLTKNVLQHVHDLFNLSWSID